MLPTLELESAETQNCMYIELDNVDTAAARSVHAAARPLAARAHHIDPPRSPTPS